jgi:hypothetical protein
MARHVFYNHSSSIDDCRSSNHDTSTSLLLLGLLHLLCTASCVALLRSSN